MNGETRDFDKVAASWDQEPRRVNLARDVATAIMAAIPLAPDMAVMDFGCGTGLLSLFLLPQVARVTGVDTSRGMLEALEAKIAAQKLANLSTYLDPQEGQALPGGYDLIVSSMTLHHVPEVPALLARLVAALKPGGRLALADLDPEEGQFHPDATGVFHNGLERAWLADQMRQAGLTQVQERTAATMNKPARDGNLRDFSIFLITGGVPPTGR
ncbi:MAG: class I SAM-dependent methyltransferase [Pseudomonadota bacterium]